MTDHLIPRIQQAADIERDVNGSEFNWVDTIDMSTDQIIASPSPDEVIQQDEESQPQPPTSSGLFNENIVTPAIVVLGSIFICLLIVLSCLIWR